MSFAFTWPTFSPGFYRDAIQTLDNVSVVELSSAPGSVASLQALNKGHKPAIIADRINVKALNMGTLVCLHSLDTHNFASRSFSFAAARAGNLGDWRLDQRPLSRHLSLDLLRRRFH